SGGFRYKPTMSRTFSTNWGSLENLKFSTRCGCNPKACQMRTMAVCDSPVSAAIKSTAPVRAVLRHQFQCLGHHFFDLLVGNRARRPGPWLIQQPFQAFHAKALPPLTNSGPGDL